MENKKDYIGILFVALLLVLVFLVVRPFFVPIVSAVILAYIFYPLYKLLNKLIKSKGFASFIVTIFILLLIAVPVVFISNKLTSEVYLVYLTSKQKLRTGSLFNAECPEGNMTFLCKVNTAFNSFSQNPQYQYYSEEFLDKSKTFVLSKVSNVIFSVPKILLNLFVMFFVTFYLFIGGPQIVERLKKLVPLKENHDLFVKRFSDVTYAIVFGTLIVAFVQGSLGALGFFIFGASSPLLWGLVMMFLALFPFVGPAFVYVPASVFMIMNGLSQQSNPLILNGVLLLLWGVLLVSTIDNFLRPKIVGNRAKLHPVAVLVGVLGGISIMGIVGLIVGPLIIALFITLVDIYIKKA